MAKFANEIGEIIRGDSIEPARPQAREQVPFERISVALSGPRPQIAHGSCEPLLGSVGEPKGTVVSHLFAPVAACDQLVSKGTGRGKPALDSPPPLLASRVPETHLEDTRAAAVDVALNPFATRGVS